MCGTDREKLTPKKAGTVADVRVWADEPRPVHITISGHAHSYEVAWRDTEDGPVITDLRVRSGDDAPITTNALRRINADTLARTARRYDTARSAELGREMRSSMEELLGQLDPTAMVVEAIEWLEQHGAPDAADEVRRASAEVGPAALVASGFKGVEAFRLTDGYIAAMAQNTALAAAVQEPKRRRGGRPSLTPAFLAQLAELTREARDRNERPAYPFIAQRAEETGLTTFRASDDTVKGWVRRAKDAGLLAPDDLRKPRQDAPPAKRHRQ